MIIISGATRGIGKYLFAEYSNRREALLGVSRSGSDQDKRISRVDVSDFSQVENWISSIPASVLCELTLINCAALSFASVCHKSDPIEWRKVVETNLFGSYHLIRKLLPLMRDQSYGRIINFSSIVAEIGVVGTSAYAASKAALWGLTKSLAAENANKGITVNCLNLGYASIGMGDNEISQDMKESIRKRIPVGRFCDPEEILLSVEFLRANGYVNGTGLDINGALF